MHKMVFGKIIGTLAVGALVTGVIGWLLGKFSAIANPVTSCLIGMEITTQNQYFIGGIIGIIAAVMFLSWEFKKTLKFLLQLILFPFFWAWKLINKSKEKIVEGTSSGIISLATPMMWAGGIGILISIARFVVPKIWKKEPLIRIVCESCRPNCWWCYIGVIVVSAALSFFGFYLRKKEKDAEELDKFGLIGRREKEIIRKTETAVADNLREIGSIALAVRQLEIAIEEMVKEREAEAKGKPTEGLRYVDIEEKYKMKKAEIINKLARKRLLLGKAYDDARENIVWREKDESEINQEIAKMAVGALIGQIKEKMGGKGKHFTDEYEHMNVRWLPKNRAAGPKEKQ